VKLIELSGTSHTITKVEDHRLYHIKVKARNDCGETDFSDVLRVTVDLPPPRIPSINVNDEKCGVKITWESPDNRGSEISQYGI